MNFCIFEKALFELDRIEIRNRMMDMSKIQGLEGTFLDFYFFLYEHPGGERLCITMEDDHHFGGYLLQWLGGCHQHCGEISSEDFKYC